MNATARRLAEDIVSLDLEGTSVESPVVIDDENAASVLNQLDAERILGVAVRALEAGDLVANDEFGHELIARHDAVMAQTMRVELMAARLSGLLTERGIRHRLLKGAALAHTVARSPMERSFRDVDVLVSGADMDRAVALVIAEGGTRNQPPLRDGFDARFGKSVTLRLDDVEVDLHRVLSPGPFGVWMNPHDLFVLKDELQIAGVTLPTLDATDHLVHACYHAALGQREPVLANLRDIALLAEASIDGPRLMETVERWRGVAVVKRAVGLVQSALDVELPEVLLQVKRHTPDTAETAAIDPYLTDDPRGRFASLAPHTLRALPARDRAAFARAVGFPDGTDPMNRAKSLIRRARNR